MASDAAVRRTPSTLGDLTLIGIALVLGLMGLNVAKHTAGAGAGGLPGAIAGVGMLLLLYIAAAAWVRSRPTGPARTALGLGGWLGLAFGAAQAVHIGMEHFADLGAPFDAIEGGGAMGLMVAFFGAAGAVAFRRTGSLQLAVLAAAWCAMVGIVIACLSAFAIDLAFMPRLVLNQADGFARSGMADPRAFVVRTTLESAATHLVTAPPLAAVVGLLGGMAAAGLRSARREVAIALAALVAIQLVLSVAAIRHGLSLERPRRPPFIMAGMLLGGLTLACAYPVLAAAFLPSSPWKDPQPTRPASTA